MSASSKKQRRREENQSALTQKQEAATKEAKQTRLYTSIFVAVIAVMLVIVAVVGISNSGIIERHTDAAKVGDNTINAVEFNYYYMDAIHGFLNQYGSAIAFSGLDVNKPLDQQASIGDPDKTWADFFVDMAADNMHSSYAMYNAAVAAGHKLTEAEQQELDVALSSLESVAKANGTSASKYLSAIYGFKADLKSYRHNLEVRTMAQSYLRAHQESVEFTAEELAAKDAEAPLNYNSYSYNLYTVNAKDYLKGGTKGEDDKLTYSDEEIAASVKEAEKIANGLVSSKPADVAAFDKAVAALSVNKENTNAASSAFDDTLYTAVPQALQEWLADSSRKEGDMTVIKNAAKNDKDEEVINGYFVLYFKEASDNAFALADVRHILVPFKGGHPNAQGNAMEYTDEEKAAAKKEAEDLLAEWKKGDANEDSFAKLAGEKSTDPGSKENGGLYEDVYPGQMVPAFNDWCFDDSRKAGDTGIVETPYGYHVMFYSGDSEKTNRDHLVESILFSEHMDAWYKEVLEAYPSELLNTNRVPGDLIVAYMMQQAQ